MFPLFADEHGSAAKSLAAEDINSPVVCTSSTALSISGSISGFSLAINLTHFIKYYLTYRLRIVSTLNMKRSACAVL